MEVVVQSPSHSPTMDTFDFSGTMSSPYLSPPSSPKRFGEYYLSAPTSPSRIANLYSEFDDYLSVSSSTNPFEAHGDDEEGFAFYVSRESDVSSRSAEELFDGGKIKPLKQEGDELLTSQHNNTTTLSTQKKNEFDSDDAFASQTEQRRGRDKDRTKATELLSPSNSGRRVTRSHSPYRKSHHTWELEEQQQHRRIKEETATLNLSSNSGASISSTSSSSSKGSRRWRLKDFLLFRSASEGRGSSKDPLKKYSIGYKKNEEVKASSFRSIDSSSSTHGSRRKGHVSAHELHYAMKKAESADMKKKTFLPYRQGILGRLSGFGL